MEKNTLIEVCNVSKKFCKTLGTTMKYGIVDVCQAVLAIKTKRQLRPQEFWALKDISFSLNRGEILGIIGPNGSGKSTLLKLLSGVFTPDDGEIKVRGRVGALLAAGVGFHPMLTGRENIYINGSILGMSRQEIDNKFDEIVNFAEIKDFLDTPVKNYSSGMYVRLGFSIAIYSQPETMVVDEILSVGDLEFQERSLSKMRQIADEDRAVIFISHNMQTMLSFTKKAIYIKHGHIISIGKTKDIIEQYKKEEGL